MKSILFVVNLFIIICCAQAQQIDTLRHLAQDSDLIINDYNTSSGWGFWTGHNHLGRQQFAEKYYVEGGVKVLGVICHLTGQVTEGTPDSSAFNVWTVGDNHFPAELISSQPIQNVDLDVSGEAFHVAFDQPVAVRDSFFVAFDLYDYSHHEHPDTLAILYGPDGSREANDPFARNVIQVHSHGTPVWRDFYTQNFTNISTHLAIFPIVEFVDETVLTVDKQNLELSLFPNPAVDRIQIESRDPVDHVVIYDLMGHVIYEKENVASEILDVSDWSPGSYVIKVTIGTETFMKKVIIQASKK